MTVVSDGEYIHSGGIGYYFIIYYNKNTNFMSFIQIITVLTVIRVIL